MQESKAREEELEAKLKASTEQLAAKETSVKEAQIRAQVLNL